VGQPPYSGAMDLETSIERAQEMEQIVVQPPRREVGQEPGLVGVLWLLLLFTLGSSAMLSWGLEHVPQGVGWVLLSAALYVAPGLALLQMLWPANLLSWTERLALAGGISVALPPLLLQAASLVGLPWSSWTTWLYVIVAVGGLIALYRRQTMEWRAWRIAAPSGHVLLLAGLLSLALMTRLYVIRDLPVGMWGDSYHHTMITQLLVDNRGLFTSWEPYAPLVTFTYHYGFHANAAFLHWLTGIEVPQSVLYTGQLLNVLALPLAYVLTTRITNSRQAGLWAVVLTGFANTLPAFYVNWGRYTQLTGQVVLPAIVICWMALLEHARLSRGLTALTVIVTASLMLTHYIVTFFAALFLATYVLALVARSPRWSIVRMVSGRAALAAGLALIVAAPWLWNTLGGYLSRNVSGLVNQGISGERSSGVAALEAITPFYINGALLALAALGVVVALARRDWRVALLAVWSALLILTVVPYVVGLPGAGVVNTLTAFIALYLTVIPLAAYVLGLVQAQLTTWRPALGAALGVSALIAVSVWGVRWQGALIETRYQLVMPADMDAMSWIRENTPPDARFLVNMFPAYGNALVVGSDGGWWIPLLAKRQTTLPPVTYGSERATTADYSRQINKFAAQLREHPLPSPEGIALCRQQGIGYIYSGAHSEQADRFDVAALREHSAFQVVYDHDDVVIFELKP
jgi:hypothetical protein